ncbi:MAG: 16S rRNA (adenine(1518)-N(6)/adenine(1519)-N(6))-dimethyltransferase RsmA [Acidimicrobiales bacterium]
MPDADTPPEGPTPSLLTRTTLLELMERFGLEPHRTLGQNFVVDQNTIRKIVRLAGVGPGDKVIEIGPGLGSLTLGLLEAGADVTAVEIDQRLIAPLTEVTGGRARIVPADALTVDWAPIVGDDSWTVVANLPYNVATPVVLRLLDEVPSVRRMLVMVQREVGERLAAGPGSKAYGIPSVKVGFHGGARLVGMVGAEVFHPQPKVTSALVEVWRDAAPAADVDEDVLFDLVRAGFGQRRKMLRRALEGRVTEAQFETAGIDGTRRAEELDIAAWCRLAEAVQQGDPGVTGGVAR